MLNNDVPAEERIGITHVEHMESAAVEGNTWQPKLHSHSPPSTRKTILPVIRQIKGETMKP